MCTYHNNPSATQCEICSTAKSEQPSTIDDEEFARQLQAQFDKEVQNQPRTPGSPQNPDHNQRAPMPPTPSDNESNDIDPFSEFEIIPNSNSNSLEPRMESLNTSIKPKPARKHTAIKPKPRRNPTRNRTKPKLRRSSRLVCSVIV